MGESFDSISKEIGISKQTLIVWSRLYAQELSEAKLKVLDNVIEEYDLAKSGRLKIVAKDISRLDAELLKRDLTTMDTDKLLELKFKALDVVGKILDSKRVEIGGTLVVNDAMSRYESILRQCGYIPGKGTGGTQLVQGTDDDDK